MAGERKLNCAVYTRKSSEEGLEQEFNSLDAQREACEAYGRVCSAFWLTWRWARCRSSLSTRWIG